MPYTVDLERRVTLVTTSRVTGVIPYDPPAYRLAPPDGWRGRVAAWLWRGLQRLGAIGEAMQHMEKLHRADFVPKDVIDAIMRQYREYHRDYNRTPTMIVMGEEDFMQLAGLLSTVGLGYHAFNVGSARREFNGMEIRVIPWMRGVVVVP